MMSVYVDPLKHSTQECHLVADSIIELHDFAGKIGLDSKQYRAFRHARYEINASDREKAVDAGAVEVSDRQMLERVI